MNEPLEELYFTWLYSQVSNVKARGRHRTYWVLMRQLFTTEFLEFVPNDDNRLMDGLELRQEFLLDADIHEDHHDWMDIGCCVLEMLIALSRRIGFMTDTAPDAWFWHIMRNLGLDELSDAKEDFSDYVSQVLYRLIFREYEPNGSGGLFPLRVPKQDQREVEIWYQMCAYVLENN